MVACYDTTANHGSREQQAREDNESERRHDKYNKSLVNITDELTRSILDLQFTGTMYGTSSSSSSLIFFDEKNPESVTRTILDSIIFILSNAALLIDPRNILKYAGLS